jgi:hypothetical protein
VFNLEADAIFAIEKTRSEKPLQLQNTPCPRTSVKPSPTEFGTRRGQPLCGISLRVECLQPGIHLQSSFNSR